MRRRGLLLLALSAGLAGCTKKKAPAFVPDPVEVIVFLKMDATTDQKKAIEDKLRAEPGGQGVTFETREQAYQRFKEVFKDQKELVESVRPNSLPESFRLTMSDHAAAQPVIPKVREMPGVDKVDVQPKRPASPR